MSSEEKVQSYLEKRGLVTQRFSKKELRAMKTPDFKVYHDEEFAFYCEVKESEEDQWLNDKLEVASPGEIVGGLRDDPVFNRLTTHINKARKQFDSVNSKHDHPNVLAFYNSDINYGFKELIGVVTGKLPCDDGTMHKVFGKYSDGRVKKNLEKIDLIIWFDKFNTDERYFFLSENEEANIKLSAFLSYDYSRIKKL
jgi:hypothetical protein